MMDFKAISAQPATDYYAWQIEVYLHNFKEVGYDLGCAQVLGAFEDDIPESWIKLQGKFPDAKFFFYRDDRTDRTYPPSVQANIMKKHFKKFPELKDSAVFFHDCDFVFTSYFDFEPYLNDNKWYFSDTRSYMGANYIESKGAGLLEGMCSVIGMCPCLARANAQNTGGAQKLMKNLTEEYWQRVENGSVGIYKWLIDNKDNFGENKHNDIQIWTSSMWSELWNAWNMGFEVVTPMEFNFCWATDMIEKWDSVKFFHNAGVTSDREDLFFKGKYTKILPYGADENVSKEKCSSKYFDLVQRVGKESVLIS